MGLVSFCFHAIEDTKQKKVTALDRGPPLHVNRVFVVRKNKFPRPKPGLIEYRSMKNFDNAEFLTELENAPWDSAYCFSDVDDIWGHWSALNKIVLDRHAPVKKKWVRGDQLPWISSEIQHEIARRNRLFKRYRKNPTNNLCVAYKQQRNKVTSQKRKGINEFCSNATSNAKSEAITP